MTWLRNSVSVLLVAGLLASCVTIADLTRTTAQTGDMTDREIAAIICTGPLRNLSYDSRVDSQITQDELKKYNAERNAYCAEHKD